MTYLEALEIQKKRFSKTPKDQLRLMHQEKVVEMALFLNDKYQLGLDEEKIKLAGILHDYCKVDSDEVILAKLVKYEKDALKKYQAYLPVVHGILAYYEVQEDLGINDPEILNAIRYHTTGRISMSPMEILIYVSDAVEETRTYPNCKFYRESVMQDFYHGFFTILKGTYFHLLDKGLPIEKNTKEAYLYYKEQFNEF